MIPAFGSDPRELDREALLRAFVEGARSGTSERLFIEGDTLSAEMCAVLAIRVEDVMLVRTDLPSGTEDLVDALKDVLSAAGLREVDPDALLGTTVGIELGAARHAAWALWAADAAHGHAVLQRRALGEGITIDEAAVSERAAIDATLQSLERSLGFEP